MYPNKNMLDYMTEMNRLFPREIENDVHSPGLINTLNIHSPLNITNRSSSSTDSFSPESFPDMSFNRSIDRNQLSKLYFQETPCTAKRQRPIVGRKILGNQESRMQRDSLIQVPQFENALPRGMGLRESSPAVSIDEMKQKWEALYQHTPPHPSNFVDQKNYTQNTIYELFPTENKGFELRTPVKTRPSSFASSANISPSSSISPVSTNIMRFPTPPPPQRRNITPYLAAGPSKLSPEINPEKICTFCRKNGETPLVYMNHTVKERVGNRNVVTCPILRSLVCSTCGAYGDDAHTITYCPILRSSNDGRPLQSTTITLKNTRVKSNGRKRF